MREIGGEFFMPGLKLHIFTAARVLKAAFGEEYGEHRRKTWF